MARPKKGTVRDGAVVAGKKLVKALPEGSAEGSAEGLEPVMGAVEDLGFVPASMFASMGDDAYVVVSWLNPESKQYEPQGRLEAGDDDVMAVQRLCGGGKYVCREMGRDPETGHMGYTRQRTVVIGGEHFTPKIPKPEGAKPEVGTRGEAAVLPTDLTAAISAQIIKLLDQGQQMTQQQVEGTTALFSMMQKQQERPPQDDSTLKLLIAMIEQNSNIVTALITGKSDTPAPADPLTMVEKIGAVLKATSPSSTGLTEALEAVSAIINLKTDLSDAGAGPPEDPIIRLATTYLPKFFELAQQEKDEGAFVKRAQALLPASTTPEAMAPAATAPVTQPKPVSTDPMWQQVLKFRRARLLSLARSNADPETMADAEYQEMSSQVRGPMAEWLATPNAFGLAMQLLPELQMYPQWSERFFSRLHANFYPEVEEEELTEGGAAVEADETQIEIEESVSKASFVPPAEEPEVVQGGLP